MKRHLNSSQKVISAKNVKTNINKVTKKPKYIKILSTILPIYFFGTNKIYNVLTTNKNESTPISNSNPKDNILSRLNTVMSISLNCQNKKTILNKKEKNTNHPEKPNRSAYRFDTLLIDSIKLKFSTKLSHK